MNMLVLNYIIVEVRKGSSRAKASSKKRCRIRRPTNNLIFFVFKLLGNQEFLFYQLTLGGKYEEGSSCI